MHSQMTKGPMLNSFKLVMKYVIYPNTSVTFFFWSVLCLQLCLFCLFKFVIFNKLFPDMGFICSYNMQPLSEQKTYKFV